MARQPVKNKVAKWRPELPVQTTYVLTAGVVLLVLFLFRRPRPTAITDFVLPMWTVLLILAIALLWYSPSLRRSLARLIDPDDRGTIDGRSAPSDPPRRDH